MKHCASDIIIGVILGCLLFAITFYCIRQCQEIPIPVPGVNRIVSEKVSKHKHHGIQASWNDGGTWYFTYNWKDRYKEGKWVKI